MKNYFFLAIFILSLSCGCSPFSPSKPIQILNWNVQNLFDAVDNGSEYPEFDPSSGKWNESLFHDRLELLSKAILEICPNRGPDILVLQEVENKNVIETLNKHYLQRCGYRYRFISQNEGPIQIGLLTRCKVEEFRSHRMAVFPETSTDPFRDITQALIMTPRGPIKLFMNHWKSKIGGARETEANRIASATLLNSLFSNRESVASLACGDFNLNHDEFIRNEKKYLTALLPASVQVNLPEYELQLAEFEGRFGMQGRPIRISPEFPPAKESLKEDSEVLFSPWLGLAQSQAIAGSYWYDENWETIDHFLLSGEFFDGVAPDFSRFEVVAPDFLLTQKGAPKKWITEFEAGYSDHLPLLLEIK